MAQVISFGGWLYLDYYYFFFNPNMQDEIIRMSTLQPQIERLKAQSRALKEKEGSPVFLDADLAAFTSHFKQILADMHTREKQLQTSEYS